MLKDYFPELRKDCLLAASAQSDVRAKLANQHIAVTGGTGFLGSWIAETVAAINDEFGLGITLDLYSRNTTEWAKKYPHLASRADIRTISQDVRSPFAFHPATSYVIHAAGIPDNRVHASDPLRVYQTTVYGMNHALEAAAQLTGLKRLINISSCLVSGTPDRIGALSESDYFPIPAGQLHTVYREAKRAAESLCAVYRSQCRLPISTLRPFTFAGPYQELDRPWAINNFMRDVLTGSEIRVHGDGSARRSYLYGSDAAWWTLSALTQGMDGQVYNLGSAEPITHLDLVKLIADMVTPKAKYAFSTVPSNRTQHDDLYPDTSNSEQSLGVRQTCSLQQALEKTYGWYALKRV